MKEGFYLIQFTGQADSGHGILVLDSGDIIGADVGGCKYDGTYISRDNKPIVDASITLTVPPGVQLVTGVQPVPTEIKFNFTFSFNSETPKETFRVETPAGPVNAIIQFLRHRRKFPNEIDQISEKFIEIYNQAETAEDNDLNEICGPGYRKALEFLIKDFCILKNPDDSKKIKKNLLGNVIDNYIDDSKIKNNAKRAAWLGNDETHFEKKWDNKEIKDLKKLIQLTVDFIHNDFLTEKYKQEMP